MKVGTAVGGESKTIPLGLLWGETTNQLKNHREERIVQHPQISQSDHLNRYKKKHLTKLNIHL